MEEEKFYIVNKRALPEIFRKVMEVKDSISLGEAKDVSEAIKKIGISRSTYYKYKDSIFPMNEGLKSKKVTLTILMSHREGALSKVLECIAFFKANTLTINQDIPTNMGANVTVTIDTSKMEKSISQLTAGLNLLPNVISVNLLATE